MKATLLLFCGERDIRGFKSCIVTFDKSSNGRFNVTSVEQRPYKNRPNLKPRTYDLDLILQNNDVQKMLNDAINPPPAEEKKPTRKKEKPWAELSLAERAKKWLANDESEPLPGL